MRRSAINGGVEVSAISNQAGAPYVRTLIGPKSASSHLKPRKLDKPEDSSSSSLVAAVVENPGGNAKLTFY
jgi:type VI protein secretion system component Hcp